VKKLLVVYFILIAGLKICYKFEELIKNMLPFLSMIYYLWR